MAPRSKGCSFIRRRGGRKTSPHAHPDSWGPADADGNRFEADWYDWATLAAANGWLVFRPNYRGSTGYGDKFMLQIPPHLVSSPGKDIWKAWTRW